MAYANLSASGCRFRSEMVDYNEQQSDVVPISTAVGGLISLYNQVETLFEDANLKDQVVWELRTDLRFLPSVIAEVLPSLNTGNCHFDRNFFRVVQLMCKALQDARDALDHYVLSTVPIWQARSLGPRLAAAHDKIRHAVSLYNTYCNTKQLCSARGDGEIPLIEPLGKLRETLQELEDVRSVEPCPKWVLKMVARLRMKKCGALGAVRRCMEAAELEHFANAGGLEALCDLLEPASVTATSEALVSLRAIVAERTLADRVSAATGALERLAGLVRTAPPGGEIQLAALQTLRMLLMQSGTHAIDASRAGADKGIFTSLASLLASSSPCTVQANALGLMWELSVVEEHRQLVASAAPRFVSKLARLFGSPAAVVAFNAGATLYNLSSNEAVRHRIARLDSSSPLPMLMLLDPYHHSRSLKKKGAHFLRRIRRLVCGHAGLQSRRRSSHGTGRTAPHAGSPTRSGSEGRRCPTPGKPSPPLPSGHAARRSSDCASAPF